MIELDNNVFIKKWFCHIDKSIDLYKEYYIYYIDGSKRKVVFTKESTEEEIKPQLLSIINKDLKEKGWIKEENRLTQHQMLQRQIELEKLETGEKYDPAKDSYYKQEWLYVDKEIN